MRVMMMIHPMIHPITTWTLLVSIKLAIQLTNMPPPFIKALPDCVRLFFGFHVSTVRTCEFKFCYCPWNKKMETWRKLFARTNVNICATSKCRDKSFTDLGIVANFEQMANGCLYHDIVLKALRPTL